MSLRILHVVESLQPEAGSVAISLAGLTEALTRNGLDSTMITLDDVLSGGTSGAAIPLDKEATRVDLVHVHGWNPDTVSNVARIVRAAARPHVISPLGGLTDGPYNRKGWRQRFRFALKERKLIRQAAMLTALNDAERQNLETRKMHRRVEILPYGLTMSEYESPATTPDSVPSEPEDRFLLVLGPIHPVEGLVPLLKAFAEIGSDADGWTVVLAGPEAGNWHAMLAAAVRRKRGADRVRFVLAPDVPSQRAWLARASILVAPSLQIRCPVSIMQAIAAGVPVIASPCAVPTGLDGAVDVCPPNREGLKKALRTALGRTPAQRREIGQRGREAGHSLVDWPQLVGRYIQLYEGVARGV